MKFEHLLDISLSLFDGGAAGDGAGAAAPGQAGDGAQGEPTARPGPTRRGNSTGESKVVYGKQAPAGAAEPEDGTAQPPDAGAGKEAEVPKTPEERRKAFQALISGEFKDIYTEETQRIIDRRFRETKTLEQQLAGQRPVLDLLMERYGISDGDVSRLTAAIEADDAYWSEAAREAGMSVEQYRQFQKLQRENRALMEAQRRQRSQEAAQAQLQEWYSQGEAVREIYPGFDLAQESQDPQFLSMLKAGVPVRHAYEVIHMEDIKAGAAQSAARQTEKQVVEGIRAKGARPPENGTSSQSAFTVKDDVSQLSKRDREEIARRVARGERIQF